jgi:hypothetical protein
LKSVLIDLSDAGEVRVVICVSNLPLTDICESTGALAIGRIFEKAAGVVSAKRSSAQKKAQEEGN